MANVILALCLLLGRRGRGGTAEAPAGMPRAGAVLGDPRVTLVTIRDLGVGKGLQEHRAQAVRQPRAILPLHESQSEPSRGVWKDGWSIPTDGASPPHGAGMLARRGDSALAEGQNPFRGGRTAQCPAELCPQSCSCPEGPAWRVPASLGGCSGYQDKTRMSLV